MEGLANLHAKHGVRRAGYSRLPQCDCLRPRNCDRALHAVRGSDFHFCQQSSAAGAERHASPRITAVEGLLRAFRHQPMHSRGVGHSVCVPVATGPSAQPAVRIPLHHADADHLPGPLPARCHHHHHPGALFSACCLLLCNARFVSMRCA